ncbi:hypothetical protein KUV57_11210 [Epibacterium sp. DP7N7-1]|nr:hypothetical protein [Epibacterium sp. DP7N7-1]
MHDFRKLLSPKTRAESEAHLERVLSFQDMDPQGMSAALLEANRTLVDAGPLKPETAFNTWSDDEWMLYRCIPALAVCLDPEAELRDVEIAKPEEGWDPAADARAGKVDSLIRSIELIVSRDIFRRASIDSNPEVSKAAKFLHSRYGQGSAIGVAVDVIKPGIYPDRLAPDTRPPLEGAQIIATHGNHDRVERYAKTEKELEQLFEAAVAKRQQEELSDDQSILLRNLRSWPVRLDFDVLSIQACDGTVLRRVSFIPEPDHSIPDM